MDGVCAHGTLVLYRISVLYLGLLASACGFTCPVCLPQVGREATCLVFRVLCPNTWNQLVSTHTRRAVAFEGGMEHSLSQFSLLPSGRCRRGTRGALDCAANGSPQSQGSERVTRWGHNREGLEAPFHETTRGWSVRRSGGEDAETNTDSRRHLEGMDTHANRRGWGGEGERGSRGKGGRRGGDIKGKAENSRFAPQFAFFESMQTLRDIAPALDMHRLRQQHEMDAGRDMDEEIPPRSPSEGSRQRFTQRSTGNEAESSTSRTFEILAEIAISSAARGTCDAADVEEILFRARVCQAPLRRPVFFSLIRTVAILIQRSLAKREMMNVSGI